MDVGVNKTVIRFVEENTNCCFIKEIQLFFQKLLQKLKLFFLISSERR